MARTWSCIQNAILFLCKNIRDCCSTRVYIPWIQRSIQQMQSLTVR